MSFKSYSTLLIILFIEPKRSVTNARRSLFKPTERRVVQTDDEKRELFYSSMKDILPNSCLVMIKTAENEMPKHCQTIQAPVHKAVPFTAEEIAGIEQETIGQSENEAWHTYRKGRITASMFYRVYTKVETIRSTGDYSTADKLVQCLKGHTKPPEHLASLKYGREMEVIAKEVFCKYFGENHRQASVRECGLFIYKTKQYIGASPDLLAEC